MSANDNTSPVGRIGPEWNHWQAVTFGGMFDTHIETGEDYDTISLASIFTMQPDSKPKGEGPAFIPSLYCDFNAREHATQRDKGEYVALTGDIDGGDHDLPHLTKLVRGFVGDSAWLIYSSAHARPGDMRWRVIIPLSRTLRFEHWCDAQNAFFNFMEDAGVDMDHALERAAQPVYLPNVPQFHEKSGTALRGEDGEPLYYARGASALNAPGLPLSSGPIAVGVADIRRKREADERERQRIRDEAERRRAANPPREGAQIIDEFNRANKIDTLLELYGYERSLRNADDWRSPNQTSGSYATRVFGDHWVSLSGSDTGARIGQSCKAGCYGDAYDLFVHFEHGGDHKAAFRALYSERRAATVPQAPPPIDTEDPGWTELPEGMDEHAEPLVDVPEVMDDAADTFDILTLDQLETLPPPSYLVEGFIVDDGLSVFYGDPGGGKSFVTVDLAMRLALGWEWHGQKTEQTGVLYVAGEGVRGLGKRTRGWRIKHGVSGQKDIPFALMPTAAQILDASERAKLIRTIDKARETMGFKVGMVVIDTVSRSIAGADENTQETMSAFVKACDDIRAHIGGAVIGVHHSGKDKDKGMRGSTVLLGACDATFKVQKQDLLLTLTCEKQKDDEQPAPVYFDMEKFGWPSPIEDDPEHFDTTLIPVRRESRPDATEGVSRDMIRRAFGMMADAWGAGKPLSNKVQTRTSGRYAPAIFKRQIGGSADAWKELICCWLENGNLTEEVADNRSKLTGLNVIQAVL
jgi:hypothetical protein